VHNYALKLYTQVVNIIYEQFFSLILIIFSLYLTNHKIYALFMETAHHEHRLYPQFAQFLQPSLLISDAEPQDGHRSLEAGRAWSAWLWPSV